MRVRQIKNSTITLNNASLMVNMKLIFFHLIPLVDLVEPMRLLGLGLDRLSPENLRNFMLL